MDDELKKISAEFVKMCSWFDQSIEQSFAGWEIPEMCQKQTLEL